MVVALGIVAGAFIGLPARHFGGLDIGLSMSVGVLLGGLVAGRLRSAKPRIFGRIPGPTSWIFRIDRSHRVREGVKSLRLMLPMHCGARWSSRR